MVKGLYFNFLHLIDNDKNSFIILIASLIVLVTFLFFSGYASLSELALVSGDVPSYLLFPFHSLTEAFSSHRTFGFSALLQGYGILDKDLSSLPLFLIFLYSLGIVFIYFSLINIKLRPIISLAVCISLMLNSSFLTGLETLTAATLVAISLLFILGMVFRFKENKVFKHLSILSFLIFICYQTRPNMATLIILVPIWLAVIQILFRKNTYEYAFNIFIKSIFINFIPLILFLLIRFLSVGEIGMNSFSGTVLSGQSTSYLSSAHIPFLEGETKKIADGILERRNKVSAPCNKASYDITNEDRHFCGNIFVMISWLEAIKYHYNLEPFEEVEKNIEPWLHKELSAFFSINNLEVDNTLKEYSYTIIRLEPEKAFSRALFEYKFALASLFELLTQKTFYRLLILLFFLSIFLKFIFRLMDKDITFKPNTYKNDFSFFICLSFIFATYFLQGILVSGALLHLDYRYISASLIFLPAIFFTATVLLHSTDTYSEEVK